ncbi:MAG: glycosyl hydrolase family 18 protein [Anaerolineae bacterium]
MKSKYFFLGLVCFLAACAGNQDGVPIDVAPTESIIIEPTIPPTLTPEPTMTPDEFRVVAYVTTNIVPSTIPYERLTHINYSFLLPNADGTFKKLVNGWKLKQIVEEAHAADVEVLISVGGWGWEKEFEAMAADDVTRTAFVANLKAIVDEYDLDGADVDWEYPILGQSDQEYLLLMQEIREAMPDKLITTAVVSHGSNGDGVPSESFEIFDFVNVMTYDGPEHGSMGQFDVGLNYWAERGLPADKTVMGIPFYARPSEKIYRKIVEDNPDAAMQDSLVLNGTEIFYNGIPTVKEKTKRSQAEAGGVMFWTLDNDAAGELSLLGAIDEMVKGESKD